MAGVAKGPAKRSAKKGTCGADVETQGKKRIDTALKDYRKIEAEIAPFVKKRGVIRFNIDHEWVNGC